MKFRNWVQVCTLTLALTTSNYALAKYHGHGRGHEKREERMEERHERAEHFYADHDREEVREWYGSHRNHLPPGLAKRDSLPPGLAKHFVVRETLAPELRTYVRPCPVELERRLPPPPPDYSHVVINGSIVLLNRKNFFIADVFHIDIP